MAFLITCSGSKNIPTQLQQGHLEELFGDQELRNHRINLIQQCEVELDWSKTLPAYQLYSGPRSKIYKKISLPNWNKPCVEIKILSALFGWIRHTDLIPWYDLKISDRKVNMPNSAKIYWRNLEVLLPMLNDHDIDLLSANYKNALSIDGTIPPQKPNDFEWTDRGDCVGYWLENCLNQINCNENN
jgi:cytoplasmic iron level regulating protein YaaA (DUF328/UPF0246 family)